MYISNPIKLHVGAKAEKKENNIFILMYILRKNIRKDSLITTIFPCLWRPRIENCYYALKFFVISLFLEVKKELTLFHAI
jgi:hypothetical protein